MVLIRSFNVARIYDVDVKIHPTFALLFIWVIYQWGFAMDAGARGIAFGTIILVAIFGCVLAHELAHAIVAKRHGLAVHDITLLPIGGVARIEHVALSPRSETLIALAGPVTNLAIALILTPIVLLVAVAHSLNYPLGVVIYAEKISVIGFIFYMWIANIVLALFNLLPAFPMDGGRVLRAQLSGRLDRLAATRLAVSVGRVFAIGLALLGVVSGDLILLLISLFILVAAQIEARYVHIESTLRKMNVGHFALWEAGGISPSVPLVYAMRGGPRDLVVTQDGKVVGMLWRHDLLKHLSGGDQNKTVRDVMDRQFHPVDADDSVYDVHLWLSESNRGAVPVVEDGTYRGIFTGDRLAHVFQLIDERQVHWKSDLLASFIHRLRLVLR